MLIIRKVQDITVLILKVFLFGHLPVVAETTALLELLHLSFKATTLSMYV